MCDFSTGRNTAISRDIRKMIARGTDIGHTVARKKSNVSGAQKTMQRQHVHLLV